MNSKYSYIVAILLLTMPSCRDQGSSIPELTPQIALPGQSLYQPGRVEVKFTTTVSRGGADQFVQDFKLTLLDFSDQNDSTHLGLIAVPVGKEQFWVDTLKTFPQIIDGASLVPMVHIN